MRLGGWTRVAIVLSVTWIVVAFLYLAGQKEKNLKNIRAGLYAMCRLQLQSLEGFNFASCMEQARTNIAHFQARHNWSQHLILAAIPVPIAWLLVYLVRVVTRRVRRGLAAG